jgi:Methylene-tetrahydrofolate reductase C terminal
VRLLRKLQEKAGWLEIAYSTTHRFLQPFRRWLKPGGSVERVFVRLEKLSKGPVFDCQMCGQCTLRSTGMTCPMTCPKNLRNGPCGGVRLDGHCEVVPEMPCVWVAAWERSKEMPPYGLEILNLQAPLNRQLQGTSAWINDLNGVMDRLPAGWER